MTALFIAKTTLLDQKKGLKARILNVFSLQGAPPIQERRTRSGWTILHAGYSDCDLRNTFEIDSQFGICCGSFIHGGEIGSPALRAYAQGDGAPNPPTGQYALVFGGDERFELRTDPFGAFQIYRDQSSTIFSSSFVAALEAQEALSIDHQGFYEFATNGYIIGPTTLFREISTLESGETVYFHSGQASRRKSHTLLNPQDQQTDPERVIPALQGAFLGLLQPWVDGFGDGIACPLSGGLDSRLLLAGLRALNCRPKLYVYGGEKSEDVQIASLIAKGEGLELQHVEKSKLANSSYENFESQVNENYYSHDGLPNFGGIFDNGGNAAAAALRHAHRGAAASGGCGEIFRNFFFLPDAPLSLERVVDSFYGTYIASDFSRLFSPRMYAGAIRQKISEAIGGVEAGKKVHRRKIEEIYPRIRCVALFGRELSSESRRGPYLMPFLNTQLVQYTLNLPISSKNNGILESKLLCAIDPRLASYPSAYGRAFDTAPTWRNVASEAATRFRPGLLRKHSYQIRRKFSKIGDEHGDLPAPEHLSNVIDLELPLVRKFAHPEKIGDPALLRRLTCLEYVLERQGSKLIC